MSLKLHIVVVFLGWVVLFTILPFYTLAKDSSEQLFQFAEELFKEGEFYRAITEYRRFLSYFPESDEALDAHFRIFECYFYGERYSDAMAWSRRTQNSYPQKEVVNQTNFNSGKCLFKLENYPGARHHFSSVVAAGDDSALIYLSRYWIGLSCLREDKWEKASDEFGSIPSDSFLFPKSQFATQRALEGKSLAQKSPLLALLFSVVPGGGYIYTGNIQTGISALVVNTLFAWGAYSAFNKRETGVGVVLGVITFGWYTGGIYGSLVGTYKYNLQVKRNFWQEFDL